MMPTPPRDPVLAIVNALQRDVGGIVIIWCADLGLREWLVDEVESLVPRSGGPFRTRLVEDAIASPDEVALLVPDAGRDPDVVAELDGSRDRLRDRTQPVIVFLLRDPVVLQALARAPSLDSWVRGSEPDPEADAAIDVAAERDRFQREAHLTPEQWLAEWRSTPALRTASSYARAYWAMLLEGR
jgi:hypothetical protein